MKEVFVPISQSDTQRVKFALPLPPYLETERVGVNAAKIDRLCRIGGIKHLTVTGEDGEISSFTPTIVGISKKGEALAAKTGAKTKAPTYSIDSEGHSALLNVIPGFRHTVATLNLNLGDVADRIMKDSNEQGKVRDVKKWTPYLDESLKKGLSDIAMQNLISAGGKKVFIVMSAVGIGLGLMEGITYSPQVALIPSILFIYQVSNYIERYTGRNFGLQDYRWSLFSGLQFDRAFVARTIINRGNLIKALPKPEEA